MMALRPRLFRIVILAVMLATVPGTAAVAGSWFRVGAGLADMAMDDINDADLRFYEDTIHGYNFPDVGTGLLMDVAFGYDVGPHLGIGVHWDRQWAKVKGTDVDVDGTLGLHAHAFVGRVYWRPLRSERWRLGLVAGTGPLFTDGYAKVSRGTVNYGEYKLGGSAWSVDAAVAADRALGERTILQVWAGWRWAKISEFTYEDRRSGLSLDYTGWTLRAGLVFGFGDEGLAPAGDMR